MDDRRESFFKIDLCSEGLVNVIMNMLRESLEATITRKIGYVLSRAAYTDFKKRVDYSEYGGAPLLGVKGVCIIVDGRDIQVDTARLQLAVGLLVAAGIAA